jgi:predicted Zn-dependent protease
MAQNYSFTRLFMPATAFSSVKLPSALVDAARQSAAPMRRSVASQIEYWSTLGQAVEYSGLTAQEAKAAIEQYEVSTHYAKQSPALVDLTSRLLAAQASGSLAKRVQNIVQENRLLAN